MIKRLLAFVLIVTAIFAKMDWMPIHYAWWHYGQYPAYAQSWEAWSNVRTWTARIICPPCGALAENYYYVLMEIEAGDEEQSAVLPVGYSHNPINPHGDWSFYWGQGEGRAWRRVSMLSFYLYWLPYTIVWWIFVKDLFYWRRPWWIPKLEKKL